MRERHLLILLVGLLLILLGLCSGMFLPFELLLHLAFGWVVAPSLGAVAPGWALILLILMVVLLIHNVLLRHKSDSRNALQQSKFPPTDDRSRRRFAIV